MKLFRYFLMGIGSITLCPELPEIDLTGGIESDWQAVGDDIRNAMNDLQP